MRRLTSNQNHDNETLESAIAPIGVADRCSGATDVETFWRHLRAGFESIERSSDEDRLAAGVSRSPLDASIMGRQHRHFLECAWATFERASKRRL